MPTPADGAPAPLSAASSPSTPPCSESHCSSSANPAAEPPAGSVDASGSRQAAPTPGDRLTPLRTASRTADGESAAGGGGGEAALRDGRRYVRFDGLQRANAGLLVVLLSVGFGRTSTQLLDESTMQTATTGGPKNKPSWSLVLMTQSRTGRCRTL